MTGETSDPETNDEQGAKRGDKPPQPEVEDQQRSSSEDENETRSDNQPAQQEEEGQQNQSSEEKEDEEDPEKLRELKKKDEQDLQSTAEKADVEQQPSGSDKQTSEGQSQILDLPEDLEGMSAPPSSETERLRARAKSRPFSPWARKKPTVGKTRKMVRPESKQKDIKRPKSKESTGEKTAKKTPTKPAQTSGTTSEDNEDKTTTDVKTFSFPQYKILSGATVAPVKMRPQRLMVYPRRLEEDESKHWLEGLFQPSKMSLKLRLLRLLLVWIFFRVLNKQTGWLAERLGFGLPDEPLGPPPPRPKHPDERYVKVFHESSPHPIHVRVRPGPHAYS